MPLLTSCWRPDYHPDAPRPTVRSHSGPTRHHLASRASAALDLVGCAGADPHTAQSEKEFLSSRCWWGQTGGEVRLGRPLAKRRRERPQNFLGFEWLQQHIVATHVKDLCP